MGQEGRRTSKQNGRLTAIKVGLTELVVIWEFDGRHYRLETGDYSLKTSDCCVLVSFSVRQWGGKDYFPAWKWHSR